MKKYVLTALMTGAMLLTMTACGNTHTHSPTANWEADLENHWFTCECGEKAEAGAHKVKDDVCTVCGSDVSIYDDGSSYLGIYNTRGDLIHALSYAPDGTLENEETLEYVYGEDDGVLNRKSYVSGVLNVETDFGRTADGEPCEIRNTYHYEDGRRDVSEYTEQGDFLGNYYYDADGTLTGAYVYEYAPDGSWMNEVAYEGERKMYQTEYRIKDGCQEIVRYTGYEEDGSISLTEYDEMGNESLVASYGPNGETLSLLRYESVYDADGNRTLCRTYENDRLAEEVEYWFGTDEDGGSWSMSGKTTTYHEDGTKTVSDGDADVTWSSETTYAADGTVLEEIRYEYLRDENGEDIGSKGYRNGKLFKEVNAMKDADGNTTSIEMIDYEEDGTKTVREYDDVFELIREVVCAADGSIISEG